MTNADMWALLVGGGMPALIAIVNRSTWIAWAKAVVALASCLIAGGVTAWLNDDLAGVPLVRAVLLVVFAAFSSYRIWWKPSGIAPAIESATSPAPARYRRPPVGVPH